MYKLVVDTYNIFNRHIHYVVEFTSYRAARNYMFNFDSGLDSFRFEIIDSMGGIGEFVRRGFYVTECH